MTEKPVEPSAAACQKDSLICDTCGSAGAVEFGDRLLCPDCYSQTCASCCPEFGREE